MTTEADMAEPALTPGAPATWPCPCCHGLDGTGGGRVEFRTAREGALAFTVYHPGTPCLVCRGKGRVLVSPLPEAVP